jgi:hypothetical protein
MLRNPAYAGLAVFGKTKVYGLQNITGAVRGLMDARATTYDDPRPTTTHGRIR